MVNVERRNVARALPTDVKENRRVATEFERGLRPTHDEIAQEAYLIYLARGGRDGRDVDDWLEAERWLMERKTEEMTTL